MAFDAQKLNALVTPLGNGAIRFFSYETDQDEGEVIATDFMPKAADYGVQLYDIIIVAPQSGAEEPYFLTVDAIDADGNATLVNSARFGSDTLSYRDKAAVGRIRVPANTDNIFVSAYDATTNASAGRGFFRAASDADYTATPALLRQTDAAGRKFVINEKRLSPDIAGGDPDGVTDATAAINAIFDYIRADLTENANSYTRYVIDLAGGKYRVTGSINATGITAWNMIIANGQIVGACTGKAVLDLTGSRGYTLDTLAIYGEEDNQPSIGILAARSSTHGACDNNYHFNVSVTGWFSVAADFAYGQETTKREHCRYWNSNMDAYCGVYQCSDYVTATSDFKTILTGSQSFLQDTFDTCDWRLIDFSALYTITAITKGATTSVTCGAGHGLTNGQTVTFWAVGGMSQINMLAGTVSNATATTFDVNINSSGFSSFTSGGYALKQGTKPAIYWDGGRKHRFINCYAVAYAPDCIEIGFATTPARECTFDFHLEGAHSRSGFRFLAGTTARILYNVDFHADGLHSATSYFSTNASGAGSVKFYGGVTTVMSTGSVAALALFDDPTKYGVYLNPTWIYPVRAAANTSTMIAFDAFMACIDDGATQYGKDASGGIWTNYTPTATDADGADSPVSATITGEWAPLGPNSKLRYVSIQATMTDIGSMTGAIRFTLPSTSVNRARASKWWLGENLTTGKTIRGRVLANQNYVYVTTASDTSNNAFPCVNGDLIHITGIYETA